MPDPISQNGDFYSNKSWFQISVLKIGLTIWIQEGITYFAIAYTLLCVSLIIVTISSHIFVNISQTVHFSAVKFTRVNEKNMNFLLIPKSLKV